jgi:hypothetical protein
VTASATQYLRAHGDPYSCHDRLTNTFLSFIAGKLERIPKLLYKNIPTGRGAKSSVYSTKKKTDQHARRLKEALNGLYSAAAAAATYDNEAELQNQCSLQ